jgi:hypothetical protein
MCFVPEMHITRWRRALYHSVFPNDMTYETVMDIIYTRNPEQERLSFHSKRLETFANKKDSAHRNRSYRLDKKAEFFEIQGEYLIFRWHGPAPWSFAGDTQILHSAPEVVFRVIKPSQVDDILQESYFYLEDSGMTGYQNMYYHIVAVKKLLGITQRTILEYLKRHPYHLLTKTISKKPKLIAHFFPQHPLYHFQMDITELRIPKANQALKPYVFYLCVVIDIFSRYCWVRYVPVNTRKCIQNHIADIFAEGDIPKRFQTDNGKQTLAPKFIQFLQKYNVEHILGPPYRPQVNGFVEQKHYTIKTRLYSHYTRLRESHTANLAARFRKELPDLIQKVQFSINTGIIRSINMSPMNVHRGFHHGTDWSVQDCDFQVTRLDEKLETRNKPREVDQVFPKVRIDHIKELNEQKAEEYKEKNTFRLYDRVKVGMVYEGDKGYHQMVIVYPWTKEYVEIAYFPKSQGVIVAVPIIDKSMKVFSWSDRTFMIHDIDTSSRQIKYYLRDLENRPILRKVRSRPDVYETWLYGWMMVAFGQ